MSQTISVGRVVHFRIGGTDEEPELRSATAVRIWTPPCANLRVDFDGSNDRVRSEHVGTPLEYTHATPEEAASCTGWRTSVSEGTRVGEWRWPART